MSMFKPLYLAELSVEHNGQAVTMGQAIQTARAGEGIMSVILAMITNSPDYISAEQLTAFTKKRFGDPETSPEAKAASKAWDANKLVCAAHYLTEAERTFIAEYDADSAKIKATYASPIVKGIFAGDLTNNEVTGLAIPPHYVDMPKRKAKADAIKGSLSSFMDKLRKALADYDKARSGGEVEVKRKATDEEFHAKHAHAMLARDQKAEAAKLTANERKVLKGILTRMGKADPEAAKLVTKLGNASE
jgi:hypothetical protein